MVLERSRGSDLAKKFWRGCPSEKDSLCLGEKSLCLGGEITPSETIHHRGTEIAQRHGDGFSRHTLRPCVNENKARGRRELGSEAKP